MIASALPWLEPMHFPSDVCTVKGGVFLADLMDFTALNIFLLSSVELISLTRRSACSDATSRVVDSYFVLGYLYVVYVVLVGM